MNYKIKLAHNRSNGNQISNLIKTFHELRINAHHTQCKWRCNDCRYYQKHNSHHNRRLSLLFYYEQIPQVIRNVHYYISHTGTASTTIKYDNKNPFNFFGLQFFTHCNPCPIKISTHPYFKNCPAHFIIY